MAYRVDGHRADGGITAAEAGRIERFTQPAGSYRDSRAREAAVFVPDSYTGQTPVPMVMVLHGCQQTNQNMIDETAFTDLAERDGFIVVFPYITSYDGLRNQNCWGFWFDQHIHEGGGEPEDLYRMALAVEQNFRIDPQRRYVTGLSSGAAMAVVLGVVQSEYFAAIGSVEGLTYGETPSAVARSCQFPGTFRTVEQTVAAIRAQQTTAEERRPVPALVIHSLNDCTVNIEAARRMRDSWLQLYGLPPAPSGQADCSAEGVACERQSFGSAAALDLGNRVLPGPARRCGGAGKSLLGGRQIRPLRQPAGTERRSTALGVLPAASVLARTGAHRRHRFGGGQWHDGTGRRQCRRRGRDGGPGQGAAGRRIAASGNRGAGDDAVVGESSVASRTTRSIRRSRRWWTMTG